MLRQLTTWVDAILQPSVLATARKIAVVTAIIGLIVAGSFPLFLRSQWIVIHGIPDILHNYFLGFYVAFSVILVWEVMAMIYTIPFSVAYSVGKQFEIMSLFVMRYFFEHLGDYLEADNLLQQRQLFYEIVLITFTSVALYGLTMLYYQLQPHKPISDDPTLRKGFVQLKKYVAVLMLGVFFVLGFYELLGFAIDIYTGAFEMESISHVFFKDMFTIMILFDVLLVLATLWYGPKYSLVLRTSALTLSTILLRLSFTGDMYTLSVLSLLAVLLAIFVSWIYMRFNAIERCRESAKDSG